mmetsp:Transcript_2442/g.4351  ORF Transcript_2442/g.4351 Transcript_2442/m.4351 type:complete len:196 (-) Transcript_2442:21-608(-)
MISGTHHGTGCAFVALHPGYLRPNTVPYQRQDFQCLRPLMRSAARPSRRKISLLASLQSPSTERTCIVLVDHGSKRKEANQILDEMCAVLEQRAAQVLNGRTIISIHPAHMELADPTIHDAIRDAVVNSHATHVIVLPFFLSPGRHIQDDIPRMVTQAVSTLQSQGYQFTHELCQPLGVTTMLADVLLYRAGFTQ